MKLMVTGGMGFIGSNFIRHIYNKYPADEIVNLDALTYAGNPDNLEDIERAEATREAAGKQRRYQFRKGDIADLAATHDAVASFAPDTIVNFAAESHVDRSFVDCGEFVRSNMVGVQNLLALVRKYGIRFLQVSTDEIYGDVSDGYSTESSSIVPSNPYAVSKAAADMLVQSYFRTYHVPVITVRGSNNFGQYQYPEKLIPLAITNMLEGRKVPVHGSGQQVRTWLHVDDFNAGIDLVLHDAAPGSVYNIAGAEEAIIDVLGRVARYFNRKPEDVLEYVADRPGQDMRYAPDAGKIAHELGWKPKRNLAEALPDLVEWYKRNEEWWKKVKLRSAFLDHYEKQRVAQYD